MTDTPERDPTRTEDVEEALGRIKSALDRHVGALVWVSLVGGALVMWIIVGRAIVRIVAG